MSRVEPGRIRAENLGRRFEIATQGGRSLRATLLRREHARPREFWALRHVDLDVAPGETFGIVGRNGSGKSTLLKMLARIFGPTEGSCEVGGRLSSLLELGAGFHPEFSAVENIYLSAAIYGIPRDEVHREIESIIDFAELEEFKDQPVKTFSSGMFARLGFSVAMHVKPDVLLLDEVLAVGDEAFVQKCMGRLAEYRLRGGTMVIVTHDAAVVQRICDRALLLEHGLAVALGHAPDVIGTYRERLAQGAEMHVGARAGDDGSFAIETEIIDGSGERRRVMTEGEPFAVRLRVLAGTDLDPADVNVEFKDQAGRPLTGNTLPSVPFARGDERTFELAIPAPPFRSGVFNVAVSICDGLSLKPRFHDDAAETLTVIADSDHTGGAIRLNAEWRTPASRAARPTDENA